MTKDISKLIPDLKISAIHKWKTHTIASGNVCKKSNYNYINILKLTSWRNCKGLPPSWWSPAVAVPMGGIMGLTLSSCFSSDLYLRNLISNVKTSISEFVSSWLITHSMISKNNNYDNHADAPLSHLH